MKRELGCIFIYPYSLGQSKFLHIPFVAVAYTGLVKEEKEF